MIGNPLPFNIVVVDGLLDDEVLVLSPPAADDPDPAESLPRRALKLSGDPDAKTLPDPS